MSRVVNKLGDRILGRLVPKATAKADACWVAAWTSDGSRCETCCVYSGSTYCSWDYC